MLNGAGESEFHQANSHLDSQEKQHNAQIIIFFQKANLEFSIHIIACCIILFQGQ